MNEIVTTENKATRNIALDLLRILACLLVVLYHARGLGVVHPSSNLVDHINSACVFAAFFLGRLGVPFFLLISGYFSFPRNLETFSFLKKRLSRIIPPFVFWLLLSTLVIGGANGFGNNLWTLSCAGHLWYVYTLIGCLFLIPIVNPFLQQAQKKEIILYLVIWGMTLVFNGNYFDWLEVYKLDHYGMSSSNIFYAFIMFYGYFGYYLLGFVASWYNFRRSTPYLMMIASVIIYLACILIGKMEMHAAWFYLSLPVVLMSFGVVCLVKSLKINMTHKMRVVIVRLSGLTFGIYLIHGLVLHFLGEMMVVYQINNLLLGGIAFLISVLIAYLLSLLPFKRFLIG